MGNQDRWQDRAACKGMDTELFFPERGKGHVVGPKIRAICEPCPVRQECLDYALSYGEQIGFFGGYSAQQRDAMIHLKYRSMR